MHNSTYLRDLLFQATSRIAEIHREAQILFDFVVCSKVKFASSQGGKKVASRVPNIELLLERIPICL